MTNNHTFKLSIHSDDRSIASKSATALIDTLGEADGVLEINRSKSDEQSMDLGAIVSIVATSGATLALAQGLASWLRARRGVTVTVERDSRSGSLKAAVSGIDPQTAERIVEMVRGG